MSQTYHHVFGPVASRRLGRSLGVDLVPVKVCSLNCIYCQVGETTELSAEPALWVPVSTVLQEVGRRLKEVTPDVITFSGSGEPTLNSGIGDVIGGIKAMGPHRICVITNGTLLHRPDVRQALLQADVVMPSLDGGDEAVFLRMNRPHESVTFARHLEGLLAFRSVYTGRFDLEVFFVAGVNDHPASVQAMVEAVERIDPDSVDLNTTQRASAAGNAPPVSRDWLEKTAPLFGDRSKVIIPLPDTAGAGREASADEVFDLLARRTSTVKGIAAGLGATENSVRRRLDDLLAQNAIETVPTDGETQYRAPNKPSA